MYKPKFLKLEELYLQKELNVQKERYKTAIEEYRKYFCSESQMGQIRIFSAPGRSEIGGNHTDHNNGKVLAASINLDVIAIVEPTTENKIAIKSKGFPECGVWLDDLVKKDEEENTSEALIRGMCRGFSDHGFKIGGFKAYTTSNVLKGSGLSSSAAFEILVGTILSYLYNGGKIEPVKISQIAQYAENVFFGKPSGLLDQMACAVGGFVAIDFKNVESPVVEAINIDFDSFNHSLCIVDTKGDHADLNDEYASIPFEMKEIARFFDVDVLRQISKSDIILNMSDLREIYGDRAVLRALHFFNENERVDKLTHALKNNDFDSFLFSINESGNSSFKYLQNVYASNDVRHQALSIGLNMAESVLHRKGACRVHGGGFAGTIQVFVPHELLKVFKLEIETVFGANSCYVLTIRPHGGVEVDLEI